MLEYMVNNLKYTSVCSYFLLEIIIASEKVLAIHCNKPHKPHTLQDLFHLGWGLKGNITLGSPCAIYTLPTQPTLKWTPHSTLASIIMVTYCLHLCRPGFGVTLNREGLQRPYPRSQQQVYMHVAVLRASLSSSIINHVSVN